MAVENPSFETPDGGDEGLPLDWSLDVTATYTIAAFDGGALGWDSFETWIPGYGFDLAIATTTAGFSGSVFVVPETFEGFEVGWVADQAFHLDLSTTSLAEFGSAFENFESFDVEWGITTFESTLAIAQTAGPLETFESGWLTSPFSSTLAISTTAATFNAGANAFEAFDNVFTPRTFTAAPSTLTSVAHAVSNGKRVRLKTTGRLPEGLSIDSYYFVVNATSDTLQLASTTGGSPVTFSGTGVGTHTVVCDGITEWDEVPLAA